MEEHIETEEQVVSILLADKEAVKVWDQSRIVPLYFDGRHHAILSGIVFAMNSDVSLTRQSYKDFLTSFKKLTPQESNAEIALYNRCLMRAAKRDDLPMLLQKVKAAHIRRRTGTVFSEYRGDKDKFGDISANRALIEKLTALEADTSDSKVSFIEIAKSKDAFMDALLARRANPGIRLTCGIKEVDETMNVGFKKGHLTLFCADVGSFKTTMMVNVALNIFQRSGENVLYIPLEMPGEEILQKIVSRETRIPSNLIEHAHLLKDEQIDRIAEEMKKWAELQNRFCVMEMGGRSKLSVIRREIEKRISYFQPRMVFIDYADNILPDRRQSRSDLEMNDILEDMRQMGKSLDFGVVSAAQLARDRLKQVRDQKDDKQQLGSTDIRGGQVMTANSDTVYGQLRDPSQPNEKLKFYCIKSRHGKQVFGNGKDCTALRVIPDIGLIESAEECQWGSVAVTNGDMDAHILQGTTNPPPEDEDEPF